MEYTIDQTETETTICILENGEVCRTHIFRSDVTDAEALAEVLLNDAIIDKQREGEPK